MAVWLATQFRNLVSFVSFESPAVKAISAMGAVVLLGLSLVVVANASIRPGVLLASSVAVRRASSFSTVCGGESSVAEALSINKSKHVVRMYLFRLLAYRAREDTRIARSAEALFESNKVASGARHVRETTRNDHQLSGRSVSTEGGAPPPG